MLAIAAFCIELLGGKSVEQISKRPAMADGRDLGPAAPKRSWVPPVLIKEFVGPSTAQVKVVHSTHETTYVASAS